MPRRSPLPPPSPAPLRRLAGPVAITVAAIAAGVPLSAEEPAWLPVDPAEIRETSARRAPEPIVVDGVLDESAWEGAVWSPRFVDLISGKPAALDTRAAVLWDDTFLYVGFRIEEPDVRAELTERDAPIYTENDAEIFIAGRDGYYEFEINALGTLYEAFFVWASAYESGGFAARPGFARDGEGVIDFNGVGFPTHPRGPRIGFMRWDFPGVKSAVHIDGTLNDSSDTDRGWTVEVAFPWKSMEPLAAADGRALPPADGDVWRMDFSRFNQRKHGEGDSGGWAWTPHGVWDSHIPECFVKVRFTTEPAATGHRIDPAALRASAAADRATSETGIAVVTIPRDPAYGSAKRFEAVPFRPVLREALEARGLEASRTWVFFECRDGYARAIRATTALESEAVPWLALRDLDAGEDEDWLPIRKGEELLDPAPAYLVWTFPGQGDGTGNAAPAGDPAPTPAAEDLPWPWALERLRFMPVREADDESGR